MSESHRSADELKRLVGEYAVDHFVKSGMKVGLGTGTTAVHAVRRISERIAAGRLIDILVVPTSMQTRQLCQELLLPVRSMNDPDIDAELDIAIDGADAVDPQLALIKGGGAAHLTEKIVEYAAREFVVIVDESKLVDQLGTSVAIPLEVIPEARTTVIRRAAALGGQAVLRPAQSKIGPVITENGNMVLDVRFPDGLPIAAAELERELNSIPGVVENGLFTRPVTAVVVGMRTGQVEVKTPS
ncbi:ribose-5-phosphate isomerase RpiA [Spirochaeta africana]|uniref:Ribose-5-phosphate isomerase A n=1 Tax=Spirochaeta africana (strain ATCC 700263 / DSM 8902 / Z-7692) TaxID=889378 RepID=H9UGB7_SPIAZ|nr:ribose-5-phosphate isomerase RpiA [Spirochaeta africana]AFG36560.1 ribose 5-phosphate isomerase [Spirochaeta africana DSM 8902]